LIFINWHGYPSNGPEGANYTAITRWRELLCKQRKKTIDPVAAIKAIIYKCPLGGTKLLFFGLKINDILLITIKNHL
jgi:hypothetical protein